MRFGLPEWLEIINGAWAVAALCLFLVAITYLIHEWIARRISFLGWRRDLTLGMRVAISIATISLGVLITRTMIWVWRVVYGGGGFSRWQMAVLVFGAALGLAGFVCAIREYSRSLFGPWVWISSAAAIAIVSILTAMQHLIR